MSCFNGQRYLPQPPRLWSRVQNSCSFVSEYDDDELIQVPYSNKFVNRTNIAHEMAMLQKGNILQYKANSSQLTQQQRYSKIARGQWTNRNTTWATQSMRGYTNPNSTSLKRSGNTFHLAINPNTGTIIGPTTLPLTCPEPTNIPINNTLPPTQTTTHIILPPPPPVIHEDTDDFIPLVEVEDIPPPIVIQDGGTLLCNIQENACTGQTTEHKSQQVCNLTTDSDVPGTIQSLCWNDGTPTWFPRQRYIMTNSTNKWPVTSGAPDNITYVSAIQPLPANLSFMQPSNTYGDLTWESNTYGDLTWESDELCMSVNELVIYQNGSQSSRYSISSLFAMCGSADNFEEEELNEGLSDEELLEQSLPDSLKSDATLTALMQVLREHHVYADIVIHYSEHFPRPLRVIAIITQIFSMFFMSDSCLSKVSSFNIGALTCQLTP